MDKKWIYQAKFRSILLLLTCIPCSEEVELKTLEPDVTLYNEVLLHSDTFLYSLKKLYPNTTYEIRISYPASVPTEFTIRIYVPDQSSNFKSRHLLNIEKSTFKTDKYTQGYVAEITAYRIGFPYNPERLSDPIVFNIILESLHFGLTLSSWKMVCFIVILSVIAFKCLASAAHRYILNHKGKYEHQC